MTLQKMFWDRFQFWKHKPVAEKAPEPQAEKLPGPRAMPEIVGAHLVVQMKKNADWVWNDRTRVVMRQRELDGKPVSYIRIPDWVKAEKMKVNIKNYTSLDEHPELILFEGWIDKKSKKVHLEEKAKA